MSKTTVRITDDEIPNKPNISTPTDPLITKSNIDNMGINEEIK